MRFMIITGLLCLLALGALGLVVCFGSPGGEWETGAEKARKRRKQGKSTKQFLGFRQFVPVGVETEDGVLAFYEIVPNNLTVLPEHVIAHQIWQMQMLLQKEDDIELLCVDGSESGTENLHFLNKRIAEEKNDTVRELLQKDKEMFEQTHHARASMRQFYLVARMNGKQTAEQQQRRVTELGRLLGEHNLTGRLLDAQQIRRLLGIYYLGHMYAETWTEGEYYGYDENGQARNEAAEKRDKTESVGTEAERKETCCY
ncbi:MAG: hypothetical protein Q4C48_06820 [Lachnospiraceae bacterium]|nr:hypothetical protein [Lachnospiraceae bacterium]